MNLTRKPDHLLRNLIAPGTIAMLIGIMFLLGQYILIPQKVHIERRIINGAGQSMRLPSAEKLLSWDTELELTTDQKTKLGKLRAQEGNELAPVAAGIESEMKKFDEFVKTQRTHTVNNIESVASGLSLSSRKKREIEQRFAQQALQLLDSEQRSKALTLWRQSRARKDTVGRSSNSYD